MKKDKSLRTHSSLPRWKRYQLLIEHDFQCVYCHTLLTIDNSVSDHFAPFALVKETKYKNIVPSCYNCNRMKRDKVFIDIYEVRHYINYLRVTNNLSPLPLHLLSKPKVAEILHTPMSDGEVVSDAATRAKAFLAELKRNL